MPKQAFIPYREEEVFALGRAARIRYGTQPIEIVAASESIMLIIDRRLPQYGVSVREEIETQQLFPSACEDSLLIASLYPPVISTLKVIALRERSRRNGERISLREIFWHEYFHINWSPNLEAYDPQKHEYITHGVLDRRDEKSADLFAAATLIDRVERGDTSYSISDRSQVSERLADIAIDAEMRKGLYSRDWLPRFA